MAAAGLAANPVKGAKYSGALALGGDTVTFKVAKSGKFTTTIFIVTDTGTKLKGGRATGKFTSGGKEKGTIKPLKLPSDCTAKFKYSTTAAK